MSGGAAAYANTMPLYVYALVEIGPRMAPHLRTGVRRERIHLEPIGRIGVLIGRIQSSPTASESALRTHDAVVRHASRMWNALLPVRFGTIVPDERALRRLVVDRRPSLAKALACVRGRVQMTVRVFGPAPALTDDAALSIGRVKGPGTRYLRRAAAIEARLKRLPELDPLREAVKPFVRDERVEPQAAPPLIASVFHLIDRTDVRDYRCAVAAVGGMSLRVGVSGPFPPYAFGPDDL